MLVTLIAVTFLAGIFAGIIILAMIFVHIVNKDDKTDVTLEDKMRAASQDVRYEKHDGVWSGPILTD